MGFYMRSVIAEVLGVPAVGLTTDSCSLMALATSIHDPEERLNKIYLAAIREALENGDLKTVHWSPGQKLLADANTNDKRTTADLLRMTLTSGRHNRPIQSRTTVGQPLNR